MTIYLCDRCGKQINNPDDGHYEVSEINNGKVSLMMFCKPCQQRIDSVIRAELRNELPKKTIVEIHA